MFSDSDAKARAESQRSVVARKALAQSAGHCMVIMSTTVAVSRLIRGRLRQRAGGGRLGWDRRAERQRNALARSALAQLLLRIEQHAFFGIEVAKPSNHRLENSPTLKV